ncbi:MAG: SDR family oxidoreductase [bacterium]
MSRQRRRILITGGSGFVGGHLLSEAKKIWDVFTTYRTESFSFPGVQAYRLDLEDGNRIRKCVREIRPDTILHTAAWSDLDACEKDADRTFRINAEATGILAEMCEELGCRFLYTSSDMAFDGKKGDYVESDTVCPINVYGESKVAGEAFVRKVCSDHVIARLALVYGRPVTGSNSFSEWILGRVRRRERVPLFTDQHRTPVLVQNVAEALLELAGSEFVGTIHLGGAEKVDRYTFGLRLAEIRGFSEELLSPVLMSEVPTVAARPRDVSFNSSKAKKLLKTNLLGYRTGLTYA